MNTVVPKDVTSDRSTAVASTFRIAVPIKSSDLRRTHVEIQLEARMLLDILH